MAVDSLKKKDARPRRDDRAGFLVSAICFYKNVLPKLFYLDRNIMEPQNLKGRSVPHNERRVGLLARQDKHAVDAYTSLPSHGECNTISDVIAC